MTTTHVPTDRDRGVLSKYLLEAHGKERQLETALQAQIFLARRPSLEEALRDHLAATRDQIDALEHRLFDLGHEESKLPGALAVEAVAGIVGTIANKSIALAKGPIQAIRGTSGADNELRNVRDCYWNEAEEIAHYRVIEQVAEQIGDTTTADLARKHRAEEEDMQRTLEELLPGLVRALVEEEAPDAFRDAPQAPSDDAPAVKVKSTPTKTSAAPTQTATKPKPDAKPRSAAAVRRKPAPKTAASTRKAAASKSI